jgi:chemotaxis protein MotA
MLEIILGLIVGLGSVVYVMLKGNVMGLLFDVSAFVIVFGGTTGAIIITYPFAILINSIKAVSNVLFGKWKYHTQDVIKVLVALSEKVKRDGIYAVNEDMPRLDKFMQDGFKMILDGLDADLIRENLQKEIIFTRKRHEQIINVFRTMGTYAPIFGLLGTLLGVVQVLKNITDVKGLGSSMAMAVSTTFYGIFGANFIFLPLAGKLEARSEEELLIKEVIIEGIISIQQGDIPIITTRKLEAFIASKQRKQ